MTIADHGDVAVDGLSIEDATDHSGQHYVAALNGTELDGRTIRVDVAQAKQRSGGGGGGGGGGYGGGGR